MITCSGTISWCLNIWKWDIHEHMEFTGHRSQPKSLRTLLVSSLTGTVGLLECLLRFERFHHILSWYDSYWFIYHISIFCIFGSFFFSTGFYLRNWWSCKSAKLKGLTRSCSSSKMGANLVRNAGASAMFRLTRWNQGNLTGNHQLVQVVLLVQHILITC